MNYSPPVRYDAHFKDFNLNLDECGKLTARPFGGEVSATFVVAPAIDTNEIPEWNYDLLVRSMVEGKKETWRDFLVLAFLNDFTVTQEETT